MSPGSGGVTDGAVGYPSSMYIGIGTIVLILIILLIIWAVRRA
jgi:hypothetical protein